MRSVIVAAPMTSSSPISSKSTSTGFNAPLGRLAAEEKKTLKGAVMMWRCLEYPRYTRKASTISEWPQRKTPFQASGAPWLRPLNRWAATNEERKAADLG